MPDKQRFSLFLEPEKIKEIKVMAASHGTTCSQLVLDLLEEKSKEKEKTKVEV